MSTINKEDFDCEECLEDALAKEQLLAYLTAYKVAVEEEDWEAAQDSALDCYEILQAFRDERYK